MYPITRRTLNCAGQAVENALFDQLQLALDNNNMVAYEALVRNNINVFNGMEGCVWPEIFSGDDRNEILFWLNTPLRRLHVMDLMVIKPEDDDLFQQGLLRPDLDLTDIDEVIENLQEQEQEEDDEEKRRVILNRIGHLGYLNSALLIPYTEAARRLNAGEFVRFDFLQEYQNRLLNPLNLIATFYGRDGKIYLTELRFDETTNLIHPPL